jgi:hypothetical protein
VFDKIQTVTPAAIVENKRLDVALAMVSIRRALRRTSVVTVPRGAGSRTIWGSGSSGTENAVQPSKEAQLGGWRLSADVAPKCIATVCAASMPSISSVGLNARKAATAANIC